MPAALAAARACALGGTTKGLRWACCRDAYSDFEGVVGIDGTQGLGFKGLIQYQVRNGESKYRGLRCMGSGFKCTCNTYLGRVKLK